MKRIYYFILCYHHRIGSIVGHYIKFNHIQEIIDMALTIYDFLKLLF